jgi:hypothetical protein
METYGIASFRSRQQVLHFQDLLRRRGIRASVISTPREVAVGCGLSLRFELSQAPTVVEIAKSLKADSLVGFYTLERVGGKLTARPMPTQF